MDESQHLSVGVLTKVERVGEDLRLCRLIILPSATSLPSSSGEADPSFMNARRYNDLPWLPT
jgi:hypothetical protein